VVVLVAWTLVMLVWLVVARTAAMKAADPAALSKPGLRGSDLEDVLPGKAQWPAHNYNHLLEQPTLFYAIALVLALVGAGSGVNMYLAWAYVVLRVIHSFIQCTVNNLGMRFMFWILSSLVLAVMTVRAGMLVF
jgi:hypothetical protein